MPKIEQNELLKKDMITVRNGNNGSVLRVVFPNGIKVGLEASGFSKGIELPFLADAPASVTNLLYASSGKLYWNGGAIAGSGSNFAQSPGHVIQQDSVSQTDRGNLNFSTGFATTDNSGNNSSDITIDTTDFNTNANIVLSAQIFG